MAAELGWDAPRRTREIAALAPLFALKGDA
jgi:hypothetical protein